VSVALPRNNEEEHAQGRQKERNIEASLIGSLFENTATHNIKIVDAFTFYLGVCLFLKEMYEQQDFHLKHSKRV